MDPMDTPRVIRRVMDRLYSERRMTGDEMRDNAQALHAALDTLEPLIVELFPNTNHATK